MSSDWIERGLREAEVPASGERRERTVALARAIAPTPRPSWRARIAKPRVVVPLAVLMIAAMTSPGQAATDSAASLVAKVVPLHSGAVVISTPARHGSFSATLSSRAARPAPARLGADSGQGGSSGSAQSSGSVRCTTGASRARHGTIRAVSRRHGVAVNRASGARIGSQLHQARGTAGRFFRAMPRGRIAPMGRATARAVPGR